ncbi:putative leucine-rich repeat protein [Trypanosoma rangeli]|uniref:Putative leucine-rich repeat protein n=1 Tax=Trypanosoma rangeli TaxID=5698 RepID=A0A422NV64_TRYRA|nr:putative leucine-rich repeat protein [Trypanosoma rangeli]RNF09355.1 putative leucine-rich repeat protein [Trypanosoma rangeli]|eukprot:RNF09355.1 putative leucine-rich repeat protein [Trypanosoma rangeli]
MSANSRRSSHDGAPQTLEAPADGTATTAVGEEAGLGLPVQLDNEKGGNNGVWDCLCSRNTMSGSRSRKTPLLFPKVAEPSALRPGRLQGSRELSSGDRIAEFRLLASNVPSVSIHPKLSSHPPRLQGATPPNVLMPSGVSVQRYRAKLEECAELHRHIQDVSTELTVTQDHLHSVKMETNSFVSEIQRLKDVLFVTTAELQSTQQRVDELQRENARMTVELRAHQTLGTDTARRTGVSAALKAIRGTSTDSAVHANMGVHHLTHSAVRLRTDNGTPLSQRQTASSDALNTANALASYVRECFRTGVVPHMELLHSLYDGDRLMAVDPPISHAQLSALKRVLIDATGLESISGKEGPSQLQMCRLGSLALSSTPSWVHQVKLLSFRCENWQASVSTLLYMIRSLKSVQDLEIFSLCDVDVMRQLTGALLMAPHVEALSLPELSLTDEGLAVLFAFLIRHEQLATKPPIIKQPKVSSSSMPEPTAPQRGVEAGFSIPRASAEAEAAAGQPACSERPLGIHIALPCLDLSRCTIEHPTALFRTFRGTSVEVLVLTGCTALRDVHVRDIMAACPQLHTLDLSNSEGLTTACIKYISQHERLKVLRLENCPGIKQLELANLEVLFSSLAHVTRLWAPGLRRLPTPLTHSCVLFDFYAPNLVEVTLKGVVVDAGTLATFVSDSSSDGAAERATPSAAFTLGCSIPSVEKLLQKQQQRPQEGEAEVEEEKGHVGEEQETREEKQVAGKVVQLLSVGFIECTIAAPSELSAFLKQQAQLLRLSLHGCQGMVDSNLAWLPTTIMELDVGGVAQLTGSSIDAIVVRLPQLIKLSLKNAGASIQNADLHRLRGLGNLEVLNLLGLPQLLPEVVAAVAEELPRLRVLYHETAVVECTRPTVLLQVLRSDEEDTTRQDIHQCLKELLHLRNETALALWMEAQLPKPTQLLPQRYVATHGVDVGAPQPPLTKNTTFYELTQRTLSQQGTGLMELENEEESTMVDDGEKLVQQDHPEVLVILSGEEQEQPYAPLTEGCDDDEEDEDEKSRQSLYDNQRRTESAMDERGRIAIENTPMGPWGEADIVAEHRRHSGN